MFTEGEYSIRVEGDWAFEDLTTFTSEYQKLYAFYYHILSEGDFPRGGLTGDYPWRGGFSTVNFFNRLFHNIPYHHQPRIRRMHYASPGSIDLQTAVEVSQQIALIVGSVGASLYGAFEVYKKIRKGLAELELTKMSAKTQEIELAQKYGDFIDQCIDEISPYIGEKHKDKILQMAPNKLAALKLQLTVFRRITPLAELNERGMLPSPNQQNKT